MVPDRQKVLTDGRNGRTDGRRQNYIPPTSSGDNETDKSWKYQAKVYVRRFILFVFVLLLYFPSQQLWSWRDGQFTKPHFFLGKLEQAVNQYFVHILSLVTDNNPS